MAGGLMNLVAYGNQNVILNGNPSKTFFKFAYSKYTNFGLQKFRLDINGQRVLNMTQDSFFTFNVPRYGDLLMDTYLVVNLPNIWSPILQPMIVPDIGDKNGVYRCNCKNAQGVQVNLNPDPEYSQWRPYEFKWIDNIGSQIIKEVSFYVGGQMIQKFSGDYMYNLVERDFRGDKKLLYYQMTGNVPELNNPSKFSNNDGFYPNAFHTKDVAGSEPSIRAKTLYIPINIWFTLASQMAFPLVSLQYNQLQIRFTLRPVEDLFVVRDVTNNDYWRIPANVPFYYTDDGQEDQYVNPPEMSIKAPYIRPNQNIQAFQFYRFLTQPLFENLDTLDINSIDGIDNFPNKRTNWNADIHLMSTFAFLSQEEVRVFAAKPQNYLIKEVYEWHEYNVSGTQRISLDSLGLISNWMFYFQRTDAINRNQWSNYTNWPYDEKPQGLFPTTSEGSFCKDHSVQNSQTSWNIIAPCCPKGPSSNNDTISESFIYGSSFEASSWINPVTIGPGTNPGSYYGGSNIKNTGTYTDRNTKDILINMGILLDGKYRENILPRQIYNQVEKYIRTFGFASDTGLNCYNFALHSNPFDFQPSGAINLSKFNTVQFEVQVMTPPLDASAQTLVICDASGQVIGINKPVWNIYEYTYNFKCMEERYNILKFVSGNAGLAYAR
jgi:hypothetical protein